MPTIILWVCFDIAIYLLTIGGMGETLNRETPLPASVWNALASVEDILRNWEPRILAWIAVFGAPGTIAHMIVGIVRGFLGKNNNDWW
ncbi:MAG: hypothetical protein OXC55_02500 [Chloroflexi bacterium]|nr:hypothetical protein [Chloroflexota bacterium]